jgi:hypothetical protein
MSVSSESDDMRMLDKKQLIGNFSPLPLFDKLTLHCGRFGISDASTIAHLTPTH